MNLPNLKCNFLRFTTVKLLSQAVFRRFLIFDVDIPGFRGQLSESKMDEDDQKNHKFILFIESGTLVLT